MNRAAIYLRVSTERQETENQRRILTEVVQAKGLTLVKEYEDAGVSGAAKLKPALEQMRADAKAGEFDILLFWSLDRLSRRGVLDTLQILGELAKNGISFYSHQEQYLNSLESLGEFKQAIIGLLAAVAAEERKRISERIKAGLARVKAQGRRLGREPGYDESVERTVLRLQSEGLSVRKIAQRLARTPSQIYRIVRRNPLKVAE